MAMLTLDALIEAVTDTIGAAASLKAAYEADEMPDAHHVTPQVCVWPAREELVSLLSETSYLTLTGNRALERIQIYADVYARQRSHIGLDMAALVTAIDEVRAILLDLDSPYFGLTHIGSFQWQWEHVTFSEGGAGTEVFYVGARFTITVEVGPEGFRA